MAIPPFNDFQDVFLDFGQNQNCPAAKPLAYVEHTPNGSSRIQTGSMNYEFDWTPPATAVGNITIYVAGNAANGSGNEQGDHIYTATYTLTPGPRGRLRQSMREAWSAAPASSLASCPAPG